MQGIVYYFASTSMENESPLNFIGVTDCDLDFKVLGCRWDVNLKDQEWLNKAEVFSFRRRYLNFGLWADNIINGALHDLIESLNDIFRPSFNLKILQRLLSSCREYLHSLPSVVCIFKHFKISNYYLN
jgi:hypothetical protein